MSEDKLVTIRGCRSNPHATVTRLQIVAKTTIND